MTKNEFLTKIFKIASNINDTDKSIEIIMNIDDAEKLYNEHFANLSKQQIYPTIYEFLYNPSYCESVAQTISIHKTRKGAEMAMEFHKSEIRQEYYNLYDNKSDISFNWDTNQWWKIRKSKLFP